MSNWALVAALLAGWVVGTGTILALLYRRLRRSEELEKLLLLARNIVKERTIPIDVEIDQDVPIDLQGTYTIPTDLRFAVHLDEPVEVEAQVPIQTNIAIDTVVESSVLKLGTVKVPIQGIVPINITLPVKAQTRICSDAMQVRLKEAVTLDLPKIVVPLKARLRVNIPLRLPELGEDEERKEVA